MTRSRALSHTSYRTRWSHSWASVYSSVGDSCESIHPVGHRGCPALLQQGMTYPKSWPNCPRAACKDQARWGREPLRWVPADGKGPLLASVTPQVPLGPQRHPFHSGGPLPHHSGEAMRVTHSWMLALRGLV